MKEEAFEYYNELMKDEKAKLFEAIKSYEKNTGVSIDSIVPILNQSPLMYTSRLKGIDIKVLL